MATALTRSFPYDDADSAEAEWREMFTAAMGSGVTPGVGDELFVTAGSGRQVLVDTGKGWVAGAFGALDAQTAVSLTTNTSGSTRIDRIVLRNNFTTNQVELDVVPGVPGAGVPTNPTINTSMHEVSLARVSLSSGYSNVNSGNITDERVWVCSPTGVFLRQRYQGSITNGTATSFTDVIAQNSILYVPRACVMRVRAYGRIGFSGLSAGAQILRITDGSGTNISYAQGDEFGMIGDAARWNPFYFEGQKTYTANQLAGARLRYTAESGHNVYVDAAMVVEFSAY